MSLSKSFMRNVGVIAHVDHGKTTLTDNLLSRGRLISSERAGTARTLDCDQEEIARGITINATGVSLFFEDWLPKSVAEAQASLEATGSRDQAKEKSGLKGDSSQAASAAGASGGLDTSTINEVYVDNLPFVSAELTGEAVAAQLRQLCEQLAGAANVVSVELRAARGFAVVQMCDAAAAARLVAQAADTAQVLGRPVVMELRGASPLQQLTAFCEQRGWAVPSLTTAADAGSLVAVRLSVPEAGLDLTVEARHGESLKQLKREAACQALTTLQGGSADEKLEEGEEQAEQEASSALPSKGFQVNLIDCPGHVDFSGEVTAALRITDGALVVVDPFDAKNPNRLCVQTETVLRQALAERVRPILVINKLDKGIQTLHLGPEEMYQRLAVTIENVNALITTVQPPNMDFTVSVLDGSVLFGSGLMGWFFTLPHLAQQMASKAGVSATGRQPTAADIVGKLWGEHYFDKSSGKWLSSPTEQKLARGFCSHVLRPIYALFESVSDGAAPAPEALLTMAQKLGVSLTEQQRTGLNGKEALKAIMRAWLPAGDMLLQAIETHLPSPPVAQRYRVPHLYEGALEDPCAQAMLQCDPNGPLMLYVTKMVSPPGSKAGSRKGQLLAYARVFSGTLRVGDKVFVLDASHAPPAKLCTQEVRVTGLNILMADRVRPVSEVSAGTIVGVYGLERAMKAGTVSSLPAASTMKIMHFTVSPVVRTAVALANSKNPADGAKLVEAMKTVAKSDPSILCFVDEQTKQNIMAGAGELHLEVRIKTLSELCGLTVVASAPVVQYCESVQVEGPPCLAKSSNKHNRLYIRASPLPEELCLALEKQEVTMTMEAKDRIEALAALGWPREQGRKVFGIEGTCMLVEMVQGMDLSPLRDLILMAFKEVVQMGPLAREPMRAVRFDIVDAKMHADGVHRRVDQILPMAKRSLCGAFMSAQPIFVEPIFEVEIEVDSENLRGACSVLKKRQGEIISDTVTEGTTVHVLRAHMPVVKSFGFNGDLRLATGGRAFPNCAFSHWAPLSGNPCEADSAAGDAVRETRLRKKLEAAVPPADYYIDRL